MNHWDFGISHFRTSPFDWGLILCQWACRVDWPHAARSLEQPWVSMLIILSMSSCSMIQAIYINVWWWKHPKEAIFILQPASPHFAGYTQQLFGGSLLKCFVCFLNPGCLVLHPNHAQPAIEVFKDPILLARSLSFPMLKVEFEMFSLPFSHLFPMKIMIIFHQVLLFHLLGADLEA